jgi:hypothetical protein
MRFAGHQSWSIAIGEPQSLLVALFVRDAAGLRPTIDPAIPALAPPVTIDPALAAVAGPAASAQWARWWQRLLDSDHTIPGVTTPPDFPELADSPDLRQLVPACFEDAIRWSSARKREHMTFMTASNRSPVGHDIVRTIEQSRGRKARPFELRITELPISTTQAWRVTPNHLLVTHALFTDIPAYRECLRTLIEELA